MPDKTWKRCEREIAKMFGTERNPLSGEMGKHTSSDTLHKKLFIEVKYRQKMAIWSLWENTKELAIKESKTPLLALKQRNKIGYILAFHSSDLDEVINILSQTRSDHGSENTVHSS